MNIDLHVKYPFFLSHFS